MKQTQKDTQQTEREVIIAIYVIDISVVIYFP